MAPKKKPDIRKYFQPLGQNQMPKEKGQGKGKATTQPKPESFGLAFRFCHDLKKYEVTCNTSMTIQEALSSNKNFRAIHKKNAEKDPIDVVIQREKEPRGAVSPDFPCCLINEDELLKITFIKSSGNSSSENKPVVHRSLMSDPKNFIVFNIKTTGGKNIKRLMKNQALKRKVDNVCVYALKGEKVKKALKRDGRFNNVTFQKHCGLSELGSEIITDMSNYVDRLDAKHFQVIVPDQPASPESSQEFESGEGSPSSPRAQSESADHGEDAVHAQQQKSQPSGKERRSNIYRKRIQVKDIPNTGEILKLLRDQYEGLVKQLKEREDLIKPAEVQRFFREEYDRSAQSFSEMKRVKQLTKVSDSVCQIRVEGFAIGTGFLLFDRFVLTNAHVIGCFEPITQKLLHPITAVFSYEDLDMGVKVPVKENLVAYYWGKDDMGRHLDFALLELTDDAKLPDCLELLHSYSPPPTRGGICIVGHPDGGVKRMDPCFIIGRDDVPKAVDEHCTNNHNFFHVITQQCVVEKWEYHNSQISYNTCFFHGSSGSPVFNDHCQLIGVHTGGYAYKGEGGRTRSVMEYAFPMFPILLRIIRQCKEKKRSDIVKYFEAQSNMAYVLQMANEPNQGNQQHGGAPQAIWERWSEMDNKGMLCSISSSVEHKSQLNDDIQDLPQLISTDRSHEITYRPRDGNFPPTWSSSETHKTLSTCDLKEAEEKLVHSTPEDYTSPLFQIAELSPSSEDLSREILIESKMAPFVHHLAFLQGSSQNCLFIRIAKEAYQHAPRAGSAVPVAVPTSSAATEDTLERTTPETEQSNSRDMFGVQMLVLQFRTGTARLVNTGSCDTGLMNQMLTEAPEHTVINQVIHFRCNKERYAVSCKSSMTVLEALRRSKTFRGIKLKNKDKEIVIQREKFPKAVVNTSFPCCLLDQQELLDVSFIKSEARSPTAVNQQPFLIREDLISFNIRTKGGRNIRNIMINQELKLEFDFVCVHAKKGENLRKALKRDGRFMEVVFKKKCAVTDLESEVITEMSTGVDHLDGKHLQVVRFDDSNQLVNKKPGRRAVSGDVSDSTPSGSRVGNANPGQLVGTKRKQQGDSSLEPIDLTVLLQVCKRIPNSETLYTALSTSFGCLLKVMKKKSKSYKHLLRQEYDKGVKSFSKVRDLKRLMQLSDSVCKIVIDGEPAGTGFLLFDKFILTCAHVIGSESRSVPQTLESPVTAEFDYEDNKKRVVWEVKKDIVSSSYDVEGEGPFLDFALLELGNIIQGAGGSAASAETAQSAPTALLKGSTNARVTKGVCIIGHPDCRSKKIDICSVIRDHEWKNTAKDRLSEMSDEALQIISRLSLEDDYNYNSSQITYDTCFFDGSSGSPVFNEQCEVIGIHTGGYVYKDSVQNFRSLMEYAFSIGPVIKRIIMQLKEMKRNDVLSILGSLGFQQDTSTPATDSHTMPLHPMVTSEMDTRNTCHSVTNLHFQEELRVSFIPESSQSGTTERQILQNVEKEQLVTFNIETKGEKVLEALKRDGQFKDSVLEKNIVLQQLLNLLTAPPGLSQKTQTRCPLILNLKKIKVKEIPNTGEILTLLRDQYEGLVKQLKERESLTKPAEVQRFFREEYDKSVQSFSEVKRVKELMKRSDSVCLIHVMGSGCGTGFLLCGRFILTNAHVVEEAFDQGTWRLRRTVTAVFGFEGWGMGKELEVKADVVAYCKDEQGQHLDFALLELAEDADLPDCPELLSDYSLPPTKGGVCIIGHPDVGVKRMDPCFLIENVPKAVERHLAENSGFVHVITQECLGEKFCPSQINYDSCFFHGSSGSPVFNDHCQLIGVHTGGYVYKGEGGRTRSVMEYALP
ncbi:hypothetical protein NFI96_013648 [Prochilodus magdalenae]|nr:hypothetical protein NFI96_013648 [Prochilodus magdalenae]